MDIRERVFYDVRVVDKEGKEGWERQYLLTSAASVDCSDGLTVEEKLADYETRIKTLENAIKALKI